MGERCDRKRGYNQLRGPKPEDGAPHREQLAELELEADQEQQHHHAQFRNRYDALGGGEHSETGRTDDHAADQTGHDRRQSCPARKRHAENGGKKQDQPEGKEVEFTEMLSHMRFRSATPWT